MAITTEALEDAVAPIAILAERLKAAAESVDPDLGLLSQLAQLISSSVSNAAGLRAA